MPMLWHTALSDVPAGPNIIVANEFIDALPVHQAIKQADGWHERVVDVARMASLVIERRAGAAPPFRSVPAACNFVSRPTGSIYEWRSDTIALEIGRRVRNEGAALIIDYGHARQGLGDTLQAVAGHSFSDPLRTPGQADLTAHVDFIGVRAKRRNHRRAHPWPGSAARLPSTARHRTARGGAEGARDAREGQTRSTGRSPGSPQADRTRWANCSRSSPSPNPSSGRCQALNGLQAMIDRSRKSFA